MAVSNRYFALTRDTYKSFSSYRGHLVSSTASPGLQLHPVQLQVAKGNSCGTKSVPTDVISVMSGLLATVAVVIDTKIRCSNTEGASTAITGHRDYLWLRLGSLGDTKS